MGAPPTGSFHERSLGVCPAQCWSRSAVPALLVLGADFCHSSTWSMWATEAYTRGTDLFGQVREGSEISG